MTDEEFYGGVINLKEVKLKQNARLDIYDKKIVTLESKVHDLERALACMYMVLCKTVKAPYDINLEKAIAGDQQVNLTFLTKGGRFKVTFETVFQHGVDDERPESTPDDELEENELEDGKID